MPGQANTVSTTIEPPMRWPALTPAMVMTGRRALRRTWTRAIRPSRQALGARGPHEIQVPHLEHRGARHARVDRDVEQGERHRGQDEVPRDVERERRQPMRLAPTVYMPKAGSQPSVTEKSRTPISPTQKSGIA